MPSIRRILTEDELSGFILDFDTKLKGIVLKYNPRKAVFGVYLRRVAEYKAFNYLSTTIKRNRMDEVALRVHFNELYDNSWEVDYDAFMDDVCAEEQWNAAKALRFICSRRPSFQRRLFIFVCTLMTSLPSDTLEKICKHFGFDTSETFFIHACVFEESRKTQRHNERDLYIQKRNMSWSKKLYYQEQFAAEGDNAPNESERRTIRNHMDLYQGRVDSANRQLGDKRSNVKYITIGKVLGISEGSVASAVFFVRNVMEAIILVEAGQRIANQHIAENGIVRMIEKSMDAMNVDVPLFHPFESFGMDCNDMSDCKVPNDLGLKALVK